MKPAIAAQVSAYGNIGGEVVSVSERLIQLSRSKTPGDKCLPTIDVLPEALHRGQQRGVASLEVDVARTGRKVELAHRMATSLGRIPHRDVVLPVLGAELAITEESVPSEVDHPAREPQIGRLARQPKQVDQRQLNLRVTTDAFLATLAEPLHEEVGEPARDLEHAWVELRP
jgi:hypothetical protein